MNKLGLIQIGILSGKQCPKGKYRRKVMKTKVVAMVILFLFLSACSAHKIYENTAEGEFKGVVQIRWLEPDLFLFVPKKDDPLRFITSNKTFVFSAKNGQ